MVMKIDIIRSNFKSQERNKDMATGKAFDGKPYAGNPHVRFDEGEVASATSRRGSPLYKTIETILLACALLCAGPLAAKETILVVNAHPDDSESMAGTLYLLKDRFALHYATLTKGQYRDLQSLGKDGPMAEIRTKEEHAAAALVGAKVHWFGCKDGQLYATPDVCQALADLILELKPRVIFTLWPIDRHLDHAMAGMITLKAMKLAQYDGEIYFHEVSGLSGSKGFSPVYYVDVTALEDFKRKYSRCYASQNSNDHLVTMVMAAAKSRGDQTHFPKGARLAECFAPLTGFRLQGKPCIFNELSSPKGGER